MLRRYTHCSDWIDTLDARHIKVLREPGDRFCGSEAACHCCSVVSGVPDMQLDRSAVHKGMHEHEGRVRASVNVLALGVWLVQCRQDLDETHDGGVQCGDGCIILRQICDTAQIE